MLGCRCPWSWRSIGEDLSTDDVIELGGRRSIDLSSDVIELEVVGEDLSSVDVIELEVVGEETEL